MTTIMYSHWGFKYESHVNLQMCNVHDFQTASSPSLKMALPQDCLASRWLWDGRKQIGLVEIDNELPGWMFCHVCSHFHAQLRAARFWARGCRCLRFLPPSSSTSVWECQRLWLVTCKWEMWGWGSGGLKNRHKDLNGMRRVVCTLGNVEQI